MVPQYSPASAPWPFVGGADDTWLFPGRAPPRGWLVPTLSWRPAPEVLTMVMILSQSLDKQGADPVACRTFNPELIDQPSASIWECLPEKCQDSALWHREAATTCAVTNLIKDLSLSDHNGNPSAPPSKRQCRSLSFSDEMSSCRTSWRPLGSKVWTPVEKRRCYSGGSVQRYSNGFSTMQRSSSFSLPSRANVLSSPCDQTAFHHRFGGQPCQGVPGSAICGQARDIWGPDPSLVGGGRLDMQRSLSCSHEQFSFAEYCPPSANSTPASTPELGRRSSGLSRSRSQPCVLNHKKVGVKRRRPAEVQEPRPSLDLAKMAQVGEGVTASPALAQAQGLAAPP
ncbi:hypothetical protein CB1_001111017 [Camelus ferus]|nr:hypothetical protein CB1_001111017 [Camelus ferus]